MLEILDIPQIFTPSMPIQYPNHQGDNPMIEARCLDYFKKNYLAINSDYTYLPIQWTAFHLRNGYGNNIQPLVEYYDTILEKYSNKKFFTVVQYDGGTLVKLDNCKIFACSGSFNSPIGKNSSYIPIPLLCDPHSFTFKKEKKYKVVYCGRTTHEIRNVILNEFSNISDYKIYDCDTNSLGYNHTKIFTDLISDSIFGFCPRGYGPASFRMYETIQMGCIPIYVSDEFWLPFDDYIKWDQAALLIKPDRLLEIPKIIDELIETGKWKNMLEYGQECYKKYLTWNGSITTIKNIIEND